MRRPSASCFAMIREQIVNLLLAECEKGGVQIRLRSEILSVERDEQGYRLQVNGETLVTKKL